MASISDWANAVKQWWAEFNTPVGSFNTRVTRTPGQFVNNLPPGYAATYDKGFIKAVPDASSEVLRHESLHDLWERGIGTGVNEIVPQISEATRNRLLADPLYKKQAEYQGVGPVLANEGMAFDVSRGLASQELLQVISNILEKQGKKQELSQFQRLSAAGSRK